jgi:opacity protein-like surface antigen
MIRRSFRFITAGLLLAFAAGTQAQGEDPKLWYVAAGLGGTWYDDLTISGASGGKLGTDTGYTGNVSIGRYLDDIRVLRLELEGLYSRADFNNFGGVKAGGYLENSSLMVNFLYDIHTGSPWVPFLGGGIGYSRVGMNNLSAAGGPTLVDSTDNAFAYQFKGGVAYQFNPNLAITVAYRYFATDNLSFTGSPAAPGTVNTGGTRSHNAEVGVRFNF